MRSCFLTNSYQFFCGSGYALYGIQLDLSPGIYPPGTVNAPPGFKRGSMPAITIHQDGTPEYNCESEECQTKSTTDTTFYISYGVDGAGKTTTTVTTSTATHLTEGCSVTGTTTDVTNDGSSSSNGSFPTITPSDFNYFLPPV